MKQYVERSIPTCFGCSVTTVISPVKGFMTVASAFYPQWVQQSILSQNCPSFSDKEYNDQPFDYPIKKITLTKSSY